jgi:glycosyltransferase involved in cell wall biosynthesis
MRVGIFHPSFQSVGGAELQAATQAVFFRQRGIDAVVATFAFDEQRWRALLENVPVRCVRYRHWTDVSVAWSRLRKLQRRGRRASRYLKDCDVVVAHNHPCSAMLGASNIRARKAWYCEEPPRGLQLRGSNPTLVARVEGSDGADGPDVCVAFAEQLRIHDERVARRRSVYAAQIFELASIARLDAVYVNSEFTRANVERIYHRRATVVPCMVRFPQRVPARMGLDRTGLKVLVLSRLERPKNVDTVLRGFARFRNTVCPSAQLHVVGEGPHRERLESLAQELCPQGAIRFHGYVAAAGLDTIFTTCDVFALLPVDEPFGMVFPEAAAHGLLLVGPDHGGPLEILDGGRLGWVCDAFSPEMLAERLAEIWTLDDAAVDRRREEADRACRARYAPEIVGPRLLELISAGA